MSFLALNDKILNLKLKNQIEMFYALILWTKLAIMSLAFFISSDPSKEFNMCACNDTFISCSDVLWPNISAEINNCSTNLYPDANKFELAPSNELNSFNLVEFLTQISLANSIRLKFKNINTFKLLISQDTTGISLEMNKNLLHISNSSIDFSIGDDDDSILLNSKCFINTTDNSYEKTLFSYFSTVYLDFDKYSTSDRLDLCSLAFLNSNLDTLKLINIIKNERSLFVEPINSLNSSATIKNLIFKDSEFNSGFSFALNTNLFKSIESIRFENSTLRDSPDFDLSSFERLDYIKLELANFEQFISSFNSLRFLKPFRQNLNALSKENFAVLEFNDPTQTFKYPDEKICNFVLNLNLTKSYTFPLFNYNPFLKPKQLECTCTLLFLIKSYDNESNSFLFESELNAASECYRNYTENRVELSCDFENITQSCLQIYTTTTTTTTTTTSTTTSTTTTITSTTTSVTTSTTPTEPTTSATEAKTTASSTLFTDTSSNEPTSLVFNTTQTETTSTSSSTTSSTSTTTFESTFMSTESTSRSTQSSDEDSTSSTQPTSSTQSTSSTSSTSSTITSTNPTTASSASSTISNTTRTTPTMVTTGSTSFYFEENTTTETGVRVDIIVPSVLVPVVVVVAAGILVYFRRELKDFVKFRSRVAARADVFGSLNKFKFKIPNSFVSVKAQV